MNKWQWFFLGCWSIGFVVALLLWFPGPRYGYYEGSDLVEQVQLQRNNTSDSKYVWDSPVIPPWSHDYAFPHDPGSK